MMGNTRASKASANDYNIGGGWEFVGAAVAVEFVRRNAPKGGEREWCGRRRERHCCSCCRLDDNLSSLHSSIRISSWPARYQLLVSMKPGQHNLNDGHKYCTGPVYGQGTRREETDNASTYVDHRES
jgi:hypothetical protein